MVPDRYSFVDIGEKDQENPLPWDKIDAADYDIWDGYWHFPNGWNTPTIFLVMEARGFGALRSCFLFLLSWIATVYPIRLRHPA